MWPFFLFALVLISFLMVLAETGSAHEAFVASAWISPLLLFACYFASRRGKSPTTIERVLAGLWILVRRVVCFVGAAFFLMAGVFGGIAAFEQRNAFVLVGVIFCLAFGVASIWWGLYGDGTGRRFGDARSKHEERKRRYGWK
ncbi:hypothetical protein [Roseateles sp. BYS96W]|uniref:Uncharacterized protein n=1 Tax=Pelomonas nitida TaxID=3299027 RepID=A0ABW7G992_9BURK